MNNQAAELVEAILVSCDIYHNWKANLNKNLEDRTMLMKRSFMDYYNEALNQEELPRVFVKLGGAHTQRGFTFNGNSELGNMVSEMAAMNGTNAFHFSFGTRYYIDDEDGTIGDNLDWDSQWINEMRPLL